MAYGFVINMGISVRKSEELFTGKSALNYAYTFDMYDAGRAYEIGIDIVFSAGCDAGVVVVECAHDASYAGTWANLATINWAAASRAHHAAITGVFRALRIRISTAINGGTISGYATFAK